MIQLFRVYIPGSVLLLLLSEVLLLLLCYTAAAWVRIEPSAELFFVYENGFLRIGFAVLCVIAGLHLQDLYSNLRIRSKTLLVQQVCVALGIAFLAQALLSYARMDIMVPRGVMTFGSLAALVVLPAWRLLYNGLRLRLVGMQRVLFVGATPFVETIARYMRERPEHEMRSIGFVDDDPPAAENSLLGKWWGPFEDLPRIVREANPDRIVVGAKDRRGRLPVHAMLALRLQGVRFEDAALTYEELAGRVPIEELKPSQLIFSRGLGPQPGSLMLQSLYTNLTALVAVILAFPVMLLVALLVKLTSPGPALYRQTRVGRNGKPFVLYKFRSMRADAEAATGARWASKDDPRVTPVGRWLRLLRLDELPQLLNVLKGEMALVGPRPERPEFVTLISERTPFYDLRHSVKPGLTGWAQINYPYGNTVEDALVKLEYDLYYVKHLSPSLDFYIMFQTLKTLVLMRGSL